MRADVRKNRCGGVAYLRIYADPEGESHIAECRWQMREGNLVHPEPPPCFLTERMSAAGVTIINRPADYEDRWHTAPARMLAVVLTGSARILASSGDSRVIGPGDLVVAEDVTGKGHKLEGIDRREYSLALVELS